MHPLASLVALSNQICRNIRNVNKKIVSVILWIPSTDSTSD